MKRILLIFACVLLALVAWAFPYVDELRDQGLTVETAYGYFFGGPDHPFNPNDAVPQLDYSKESSWASLPVIEDEADLIPAGEEGIDQLNSNVDVYIIYFIFFIDDFYINVSFIL